MNAMLKLMILIVIALALAACGGKAAQTDVAASIADFTLPDGYKAEYSVNLAGYMVAAYNPGDDHSHLFLIQAPSDSGADQAKLEEMLDQSKTGEKNKTTRLTVIEKRTATIRGQECTLQISEGTNGEGDPYRQVTAAFQGKGGPALLVLSEPTTRWDDARIDQFIASIK